MQRGTADVGAEASGLAKWRRWRELTASMQADTLLRWLQRRDLLYSKRIHKCVGIARRIEKESQKHRSCSHIAASEEVSVCTPSSVAASDATAIECSSCGSDAPATGGGCETLVISAGVAEADAARTAGAG